MTCCVAAAAAAAAWLHPLTKRCCYAAAAAGAGPGPGARDRLLVAVIIDNLMVGQR